MTLSTHVYQRIYKSLAIELLWTTKFVAAFIYFCFVVQCVRGQNGFFYLSLTERNMQVRFDLKMILKFWDMDILIIRTSFHEMHRIDHIFSEHFPFSLLLKLLSDEICFLRKVGVGLALCCHALVLPAPKSWGSKLLYEVSFDSLLPMVLSEYWKKLDEIFCHFEEIQ